MVLRATTILTLISLILVIPSTSASPDPVRDNDGVPLIKGARYYVLPPNFVSIAEPHRGGLAPISRPSQTPCPTYVAEYSDPWTLGWPVTFFPADPSQKQITEDTDLNISFGPDPICKNIGVWQVNYERIFGPYTGLINTNGVIGNPGPETYNNWFQIKKANVTLDSFSYKIVYCYEGHSDEVVPSIPGNNGMKYLSLLPVNYYKPFSGFEFFYVEDEVTSV